MNHGFTNSIKYFLILFLFFCVNISYSQLTSKEKRLIENAKDAKIEFIKTDPLLKTLFEKYMDMQFSLMWAKVEL
jgi:hypothetical protein